MLLGNLTTTAGSPPRLWGARALWRRRQRCRRFTPTPVGSAAALARIASRKTVHPHACGERYASHDLGFLFVGSPPRLWGALRPQCACRRSVRFTPTPVGSATAAATLWRRATVHPHACGERDDDVSTHVSPPVHPHACGERALFALTSHAVSGSPPRLWGAHRWRHCAGRHDRFTPTPVGSAADLHDCIAGVAVHPHACGER